MQSVGSQRLRQELATKQQCMFGIVLGTEGRVMKISDKVFTFMWP